MVLDQPLFDPLEQTLIRPNMEVCGIDAKRVGFVKEVREEDFLVDRAVHRDVYVPLSAVKEVADDVVVLTIPGDHVADMEWAKPSLLG